MKLPVTIALILTSCAATAPFSVAENGSVTFTYYGEARHVSVVGDFQYQGKDSVRYDDGNRTLKMHQEGDSCFRVTTPPLVPETYTYHFRVNGKHVPDPLNNDTSWQRVHKWNIVSVGGTPQADMYMPSQQHGQLIRTHWFCQEEKQTRSVYIYLPADYLATDDSFPVLYLLHGINGYEGSWIERGRIMQIMENLTEEGRIKPAIVVMPDCNMGPKEGHPSHHTLWNNVTHYIRLCRDHSLEHGLSDLMQIVDSTYRVSEHRAIAGLSSGARISANCANLYPNTFEAVGLFSPVIYDQQLPTSDTPPYYFIYMGWDDMFLNNGRHFSEQLTNRHTPHSYIETGGGHHWRNWRTYLSDFLIHWNNQFL